MLYLSRLCRKDVGLDVDYAVPSCNVGKLSVTTGDTVNVVRCGTESVLHFRRTQPVVDTANACDGITLSH
jgi:hypothetical protein